MSPTASQPAPGIVEQLIRCRAAHTVQELRHSVARIKDELPDSADAVNGTNDYLLSELAQIAEALTLERGLYYVERLIRSVSEVRTSAINDINLNRWKEYDDILTDSLWVVDRRDSSGVHTAGYWGNFVPQIPRQMMRRYTRKGDWVLDPFAGSGTTLIEGQRMGRNTIGIELQPQMVEYANGLIASEHNSHDVTTDVINGDSATTDLRSILRRHGRETVQLVIMHPPYLDIIRFSDDPRDLSNAASVENFLEMIGRILENVTSVLDRGRYLVLVIGDKYAKGDWIPLGFQTMNEVLKRGFSLKSIVVKNFEDTTGKRNQKELWRYRALVGGFYIFKHEYIFLFRKD